MTFTCFIPRGAILRRPAAKPKAKAKGKKPDEEKQQEIQEAPNNKYEAAMLITSGDDVLSRAVLNLDRNQNNIWKDAVRGDAPEELKAEWEAVSACGFGNQKKLSPHLVFLLVS